MDRLSQCQTCGDLFSDDEESWVEGFPCTCRPGPDLLYQDVRFLAMPVEDWRYIKRIVEGEIYNAYPYVRPHDSKKLKRFVAMIDDMQKEKSDG